MPNNDHVVAVKDAFEIRPEHADVKHAAGLVIIFDGRQCNFELPPLNSEIDFIRPDGQGGRASVLEIKEHGDARSFFFKGLVRDDVPAGSVLQWSGSARRAAPQSKLVGSQ